MLFKNINNANIQFIKNKNLFIAISAAFVICSLALLFTKGLNLGVDFTGGTVLKVKFAEPVEVAKVRDALSTIDQGSATIQTFENGDIMLRFQGDTEELLTSVRQTLLQQVGKYEVRSVDKIGPVVGSELRNQAAIALLLALVGILIYIAIRFQFRFGAVAIIALAHDVIVMLGAYSLTGKEISTTFIAAILTIAGYSINNSIVILDRIRENWRQLRAKGIALVVNESINMSLSRTLYTSLTTLFPVLTMYFFGGEVIGNFAFAFLIGIVAGTFSSICLVGSLLVLSYEKKMGTNKK